MKILLYSNLWVAFCAASFSLLSAKYLGESHQFIMVFGGTLAIYGFHRLYKILVLKESDSLEKDKWVKRNWKTQVVLSGLGSILCAYAVIKVRIWQSPLILLLIGCGLLTIFYVVKLSSKNIRELPYLKVFAVSISYAFFTCILPYVSIDADQLLEHSGFILSAWLFVLGITLIFDQRDVRIDKSIKTFPKALGLKRTVFISAFLSLFAGLGFASFLNIPLEILLFPLTILLIGYLLVFTGRIKEGQYTLLFEGALGAMGLSYFLIA